MGNKLRIHQPGDSDYVQSSFGFGAEEFKIKNSFPPVLRTLEGFRQVLNDTSMGESFKSVGYDLEFNRDERPTIIGISSLTASASLPWDSRLAEEVVDTVSRRGGTLIAFSTFGADKPVTDKAIGKDTGLTIWDDARELFYLLHQAFSKTGDRSEEEEDAGSLGFYNLWTCMSIYTNFSQYKVCRGVDCPAGAGAEFPCPRHDVFFYNGMDALAGAVAFYNMRKKLTERGIPWGIYKERLELGYICHQMEERGIARDKPYMDRLQENILRYKAKLFPQENGQYSEFNPQAPAQIVAWFKDHGVALKSAEKAVITKALEERCRAKYGLVAEEKKTIGQTLENYDGELDPVTKRLWDCYVYKSVGKGTDAWLAPKYFRKDGFIHPRFVTTGTQTTRLSSSRPNFTNIPACGWEDILRGGIIPRDQTTHKWAKADNSQLELRSCLWLAGVDVREIKGDAFQWLVDQSNGGFDKASVILKQEPRQSAKSFAHGANYGEGIILVEGADLESSRRQSEIRDGALIVNHPKYGRPLWEFRGKIVCFTGANVAERLFGSKTFENRKKALDLQAIYFSAFSQIPAWHRKVLSSIEDTSYLKYPSGHSLEVVGDDVDVAKAAIAALGQGIGAIRVMGNVTKKWRETKAIPYLLVHDEYDAEVPIEWNDEQVVDFFRFMSIPDDLLPGFCAPASVYTGRTWMEDSKDVPSEFKNRCLSKIGKV